MAGLPRGRPFVKGEPRLPNAGRKKGSKNRVSHELREMVFRALHEAGGVEYLTEQAHTNPRAFLSLLSRMLPREYESEVYRSEVPLLDPMED